MFGQARGFPPAGGGRAPPPRVSRCVERNSYAISSTEVIRHPYVCSLRSERNGVFLYVIRGLVDPGGIAVAAGRSVERAGFDPRTIRLPSRCPCPNGSANVGCRWILEAVYRKKFAEDGENAPRRFSRVYTRCFTLDEISSPRERCRRGEIRREGREAWPRG